VTGSLDDGEELFTGCSFNSPLNDEVVQGNKEVYANFS
jgi:hypothetical protein